MNTFPLKFKPVQINNFKDGGQPMDLKGINLLF